MKNGNKRLKLNFMGLKTTNSDDDDDDDDDDDECFAVPDIW